ncbi:uncharacterized protein SCHCODRAFT_02374157 [Schizophyllum commune H4-8]|uniref:uncharacterized protein n=1 Tax=Schizophyllum commune (strain H4-8 / FGSC 9210) TaxID=578458 RepID=UPI00215E615E|nr:uncharacterized protein SCHCODRAFT_02374157 [Schizophyllum commune H4-8]KAI5889687.1 hypothetical protein SCHCODRAFT_02374157 [Schizophyllum commune H4-8]
MCLGSTVSSAGSLTLLRMYADGFRRRELVASALSVFLQARGNANEDSWMPNIVTEFYFGSVQFLNQTRLRVCG